MQTETVVWFDFYMCGFGENSDLECEKVHFVFDMIDGRAEIARAYVIIGKKTFDASFLIEKMTADQKVELQQEAETLLRLEREMSRKPSVQIDRSEQQPFTGTFSARRWTGWHS